MPVAELFLSAFLQALFERLMSPDLLKLAGREGVFSKIKKWEKTLKTIEAVLIDAEEKQLTDRAVKLWLDDLRDLAYDAEDLLDEFGTEAATRLIKKREASSSKVRSLIQGSCLSCVSSVKSSISIGPKINAISSRMEELCKRRIDLGLEKVAGGLPSQSLPPPSTSLQGGITVYGRDEDKARVLKMVSENDASDAAPFRVIPIVGMGGIGKTTLAREVYNDKSVEDFNPKSWVCVSVDFDVLKISKAILESITLSPCDLNDLNSVQLKLTETVAKKKFLIVLDDVWSKRDDLWLSLKSPFMAGALGSKIIVTTRSVDIAFTVGSGGFYYQLKFLSDDECWSVFAKHAFESQDAGTRGLESRKKCVVEKCKGLPLAARVLGGLLRSKQRVDEWEGILNSQIWDLQDDTEIPSVLKLSYYHLPSHLKRCFAYCAILPKDYEFEEEEIFLLWIAEGLVQQSIRDKQLEDLGSEYFHVLLSRSMFQKQSNIEGKYVMHDLVHDLAQWASGETCFRLEDEFADGQRSRIRHSSYICSDLYDGMDKFKVLSKVENLRTFLPIFVEEFSYLLSYISPWVLSDLLPKLKKLRVLSLGRYYITEVPISIGCLRHLRYLNFSHSKIKSLPESITSLVNLQILILRDCLYLLKLPSSFGKLVNLLHLDIEGAKLISELPLGMKELKCLQTLTNFIVSQGSGCTLKDLKNWKFLRGRICISGLENVINSEEANQAMLREKKGLKFLQLEWGAQLDDSRDEVREKNVLNMLQPHRNIKGLAINFYGGTSFPSWVGDPSFSNVTVLKLQNCKRCTSLPSLGQLRTLEDLTIIGMSGLKSIGSEIYGDGCSKPFESLQTLHFEELEDWEQWEPNRENEELDQVFSRLRKLSIEKCPKLFGKLPNLLPSLEEIVITECMQLVVSLPTLPALCKLKIDGCKRIVCDCPSDFKSLNNMTLSNISEFENSSSEKFQKGEHLVIIGCEGFLYLLQNDICLGTRLQGLHSLTCLRRLRIGTCPTLVSVSNVFSLCNLSELSIEDCNALTSVTDGTIQNNARLEDLQIRGCHSLTSIARGQLPSSLKSIMIENCRILQCVLDDSEDSCTSSSPTSSLDLEKLVVRKCPSLTCLSSSGRLPITLKRLDIDTCSNFMALTSECQLPEALEYLKICGCPKLESIAERFLDNACLRSIWIWVCDNLKSMPKGLHKLSHLHSIWIVGCPNLVSFPEDLLPRTTVEGSVQNGDKGLRIGMLNSLQRLLLLQCPGILLFPDDGLSSNLMELRISGDDIYKPLIKWGFNKFTSLTFLTIDGCSDAVSFPEEEKGMTLPTSLTRVTISGFRKLERLSSEGFLSLTSLESLTVWSCRNLISFPDAGFPSSLLSLSISGCPLLEDKCKKGNGREWPKIKHIPSVHIDYKFIYDPEEEAP